MLILAAGGAQTALEHGSSWESYAVCLVLVCGIYLVPRTVLKFRRRFVPLLKAYRELKGAPSPYVGIDDDGIDPVRATRPVPVYPRLCRRVPVESAADSGRGCSQTRP